MMQPTIIVVISPQGEIRVETKGYVGSSCRQATQALEQALGAKVEEKFTAEFYQQQATQQHLQQGGAT